jgi:pimeloyl-ACP methyl ester carboxylesterase
MQLEYEISGPQNGQPLLMIHGLGAQLTRWPTKFIAQLAVNGFRTIRYDSRDVGLSTHLNGAALPHLADALAARKQGLEPVLPYAISDLADDAAALLHGLGIAQAHVVGVSLGGQVAQSLASRHTNRVRSLALMMTRSGNPDLPPARADILAPLTGPAANPFQEESRFLEQAIAMSRAIGSPAYPMDEADLRKSVLAAAHRAYDPKGVARQLAAGRTAPDNRADLSRLAMPTLVIHGADDRKRPVSAV